MNRWRGSVPKVSVIKVIEVRYTYGAGTPEDPAREVVILCRDDGSEIVTIDPLGGPGRVIDNHHHDWRTGDHAHQCACGLWDKAWEPPLPDPTRVERGVPVR